LWRRWHGVHRSTPWKESAVLNAHINLYGFWNETAFLTKSGDLGMVLSIPGVDDESLGRSEQEYAVKRLEAALKAFGPGFHVYQYLFKSNRPDILFARYEDPVVEAAIDQRRKFIEAKRGHLYQIKIFYCILLEGAKSKAGVGAALARLFRDPAGAIGEFKSQFTNESMKTLLRTHIEDDVRQLDRHVQAFARQFADFVQIEVLNQQGQFTFSAFHPAQSHRESIPLTTPIPNTIGHGCCMNLPVERMPRYPRGSWLRAPPISPILFIALSGRLTLHRPDFGSSKAF
jgi:type IV secretory pathway VirB4 component